jgi:hypothetical protein
LSTWWLKMTSSGVIGAPSEKRASGRNWNVTELRSSGTSMLSAISPYSVNGSSPLRAIRLSNTYSRMLPGVTPL